MNAAGPMALQAAEDLSGSWRPELGVEVNESKDIKECPSGSLWVPSGPSLMGSNSSHAGRDESPVHVVEVSGFCLDQQEGRDESGLLMLGPHVISSGSCSSFFSRGHVCPRTQLNCFPLIRTIS